MVRLQIVIIVAAFILVAVIALAVLFLAPARPAQGSPPPRVAAAADEVLMAALP